MAESAKFSSKDITPDILKKASPARLKFDAEKMMVDAVVLADDLKDEMEGKDWKKLEQEMEKDFQEQMKDLIAGVAKRVATADDEVGKFPAGLQDNFLRPINIEIEHKFEKYAERISSLLTKRLEEAKKDLLKGKKGASIKQPKVRVDFDFAVLVSSARRSVSSSSTSAPAVKPGEASKEISPAAQDCDTTFQKVESSDKDLRKAVQDAARLGAPQNGRGVELSRGLLSKYRSGIAELDGRLRDLGQAINETLDKQELWKKKYSTTKANYSEQVQKAIKTSMDQVIKKLEALSKFCTKTRDDVIRHGAEQVKAFEGAIDSTSTLAGPQLTAVVGLMRRPAPDFFHDVSKLITEAKETTAEVQKELQKLSKAATAK